MSLQLSYILCCRHFLRIVVLFFLKKIKLIMVCLIIPLLGAYASNRRLRHRISEQGRADLLVELPFWATLEMSTTGNGGNSDVDAD